MHARFLVLCAALAWANASSISRRAVLCGGACAINAGLSVGPVFARAPGSSDVNEAIEQIKDARAALIQLQKDWSQYACIDKEGRACNIDAARKILGGVAPQRGDAAIAVAKQTPLYRIDGAFKAIRTFALNAAEDSWGEALDVEAFSDRGEDIAFALKRADDGFYSVVFASKGSTMLENIYKDAKAGVDRSVSDFDEVLRLLKDAAAPGI